MIARLHNTFGAFDKVCRNSRSPGETLATREAGGYPSRPTSPKGQSTATLRASADATDTAPK